MENTENLRGHKIEKRKDGKFYFLDNSEPTVETWENRPCGECGEHNTKEGNDHCLGVLPGVSNACCGHGDRNKSYIQFDNGFRIEGFIIN